VADRSRPRVPRHPVDSHDLNGDFNSNFASELIRQTHTQWTAITGKVLQNALTLVDGDAASRGGRWRRLSESQVIFSLCRRWDFDDQALPRPARSRIAFE
jgi:hypothetical protein